MAIAVATGDTRRGISITTTAAVTAAANTTAANTMTFPTAHHN